MKRYLHLKISREESRMHLIDAFAPYTRLLFFIFYKVLLADGNREVRTPPLYWSVTQVTASLLINSSSLVLCFLLLFWSVNSLHFVTQRISDIYGEKGRKNARPTNLTPIKTSALFHCLGLSYPTPGRLLRRTGHCHSTHLVTLLQ